VVKLEGSIRDGIRAAQGLQQMVNPQAASPEE
jgi:hypothetical protein